MNKLKIIIPMVAVLAVSASVILLSGCGGQVNTPTNPPAATNTLYTCPMHPEVVTNQPGDCPKCGMHLVPKT